MYPCFARPTLNNLNPDELHYYPFIASLDRCDASCYTFEHWFGRICVPNTMENVNLKVFNTIKGINESKTLAKHFLCECKREFDGRNVTQDKNGNDKC